MSRTAGAKKIYIEICQSLSSNYTRDDIKESHHPTWRAFAIKAVAFELLFL